MFFDSLLASGCYRAPADETPIGGGANAASEILTGEGAGISNAAPAAGLQPATTTDSAQAAATSAAPPATSGDASASDSGTTPPPAAEGGAAPTPLQRMGADARNLAHDALDEVETVAAAARDWFHVHEAEAAFATRADLASVKVKIGGLFKIMHRDGNVTD